MRDLCFNKKNWNAWKQSSNTIFIDDKTLVDVNIPVYMQHVLGSERLAHALAYKVRDYYFNERLYLLQSIKVIVNSWQNNVHPFQVTLCCLYAGSFSRVIFSVVIHWIYENWTFIFKNICLQREFEKFIKSEEVISGNLQRMVSGRTELLVDFFTTNWLPLVIYFNTYVYLFQLVETLQQISQEPYPTWETNSILMVCS